MSQTTVEEFLAHNGVKGMKWGVVKDQPSSGVRPRSGKNLDMQPNADGSIDIPKGATISRVFQSVRTLGGAAGSAISNGPTYAAFTKGDRLRYESAYGFRKNLFVREASQVATLTTKVPLKAPNPGDTSRMYWANLKNDPEKLKEARRYLNSRMLAGGRAVDIAMKDPTDPIAYSAFGSLYDGSNYNSKLSGLNDKFHADLKKSGYNMILDPSDSTFGGIYDAPIVVLDGKKNLELTSSYYVTKESKTSVDKALREHEKLDKGKRLMQRLGYDSGSPFS